MATAFSWSAGRLEQEEEEKRMTLAKKVKRKGPLGIQQLVDVCEQSMINALPAIVGQFDVVYVLWHDLVHDYAEGVSVNDQMGSRFVPAVGSGKRTIPMIHIGIKVAQDDESCTIMHSVSTNVSRSEFFVIPASAIKRIRKIGSVKIDADGGISKGSGRSV